MKFIVIALVALWASTAHATNIFYSELERFEVDPQIGISNVNTGYVQVNMDKKILTLSIAREFVCTSVQHCPQPFKYTVSMPIVTIDQDSCKSPRIIARLEERELDASFQEIVVVDNTKSKCLYALDKNEPTFRALPPTIVTYITDTLEDGRTFSKFEGSALQEIKILPAHKHP